MARGNIRKRGNKYQVTVDIGKDSLTGKRKRHYSTHPTRQEAEKARTKILFEIDNGLLTAENKQSISEFLHDWIKTASRNLSPTTEYVYKGYIKMLEKFLPNINAADLKRKQAEFIINDLLQKYKPSTVKVMKRILSTAYNRGVDWEEIDRNPFKGIKIRQEYREYTFWSAEEVKTFLSIAKERAEKPGCNPCYYIAFMIAVNTGMRKSEILGLRWENIDFEKCLIKVRESIHDLHGKGEKYTGRTKTRASRRDIALPKSLVDVLLTHKEYQQNLASEKDISYKAPSDYVITTNELTPIHQRNLARILYDIIEASDLPKIRFHDLRHTHASLLLANEVNPKVIQERLGHSRIDTTLNTYSHVFPSQQREAADLFDSLMKKGD
jgi:integrase